MSIKITKPRILTAIVYVTVLFNFLTPLFNLVRYTSDVLLEYNKTSTEAASGYALLSDKLFGYITAEPVRSTLRTGVVIHIVLSVLLTFVMVYYAISRKRNKIYEISAVSLSAVFSLVYTVFGLHGASKVNALTHNFYSVTTYAYIPLIISCVFGIAYFIVYNYLKDDFMFSFNKREEKI